MTYAQMLSRIAELNAGDNQKLVGYLLAHGIKVKSVKPEVITVDSLYSVNGSGYYIEETIPATMPAVREYLGY